MEEVKPYLLQVVGKTLRGFAHLLSGEALAICNAGLANSTKSQYSGILDKFRLFCVNRGHIDHLSVPVTLGVEFLTSLFEEGKSFSSINSARSALSQYVLISDSSTAVDFGKHPLVVKFMRGVFKLRPSLPKYSNTWDINILLTHLKGIVNTEASFKSLSFKCVTLIAIVTGQRVQTLGALNIDNMVHSNDDVMFTIDKILKTSRPGHHISVKFSKFSEDINLCPVTCLLHYLSRTKNLRSHSQLFISLNRPHRPITTQTLSRWISLTLHSAGIAHHFSAHSTRGASTSKASKYTDMDTVLKSAGWSNTRTFDKFYHKPLSAMTSFSQAVLS